MKEPKKVTKAIETIHTMLGWLSYYMGNSNEFKQLVRKDIADLEDLLIELAVDQKVQNLRLAKKLKAVWDRKHHDK
jgi:hypothetical protein